ncbi:potassium channel family protein [Saccharopolyspora oryzae]|uniref:Potassium channel family protein n=1 Tax=Saccharopolyspora oryzae TaxID=2997343 RepID=A0ABT4V5E1_9PSEU|nr:potassium channel family protein [Saccharopolyspora oryzae]MDA3628532.1 potassium channel family protein [Saccharopolyspora oryzae]
MGGARREALINAVATVGAVVVCTAVYYALPFDVFGIGGTVGAVVVFDLGLLAISTLIMVQVHRFRHGDGRRGSSIAGVVAALYLAVLFFAAVYFAIARHQPDVIASLRTKTDALYFSLSITSTVGFGDVHAISQFARAVAAVQMAFNIGFLGMAVAVLRTRATRA